MDHDTSFVSLEEAEALFAQSAEAPSSPGPNLAWPAKFAANSGRPGIRIQDVVLEYGPLDSTHAIDAAEHIDSGAIMGIKQQPLQSIRHVHHRLAQLLAGGMSTYQAALLCNYTINRVEVLKGDPAFQNLMAHYAGVVQDQFGDFVTAASDLSLDMMSRLREILEDSPERLTPTNLMDAIKLLADRSGHAPIAKSVNLNVNADMAQRLNAARSRRQALEADEDAA